MGRGSVHTFVSNRVIQGEAENVLLAHEKEKFDSYVVRPGMVLRKKWAVTDWIWGAGPSVRVDVLAKAMINLALEGGKEKIIENSDLSEIAK